MHENHRARMRERYLRSGFDGFSTHEILEMLLYYGIPRNDTNACAHELVERFGSLKGIFDAAPEDLQQIDGIGPQTAILLKLIPEITRRYATERESNSVCYHTVSRIAQFFCRRFIGTPNECLYMMLLNNRMNMIDCVLVSSGTVNSSDVPIRKMTEIAIRKNASAVVLAHNHPNGLAIPSEQDIRMTDQIHSAFELLGVVLVEHLVIADDRFSTIMQERCGNFRYSPISRTIESGFYDHFYDVDCNEWIAPPIFPPKDEKTDL